MARWDVAVRITYGSLPGGLQTEFRTRNEHYPPHFHAVRSGEYDLRVYFEKRGTAMIERIAGRRKDIRREDREALADFVKVHKRRLRQDWKKVVEAMRTTES